MNSTRTWQAGLLLLTLVFGLGIVQGQGPSGKAPASATVAPPTFRVDASWPKPLREDWGVGHAVGVAVDSKDNVYFLQRRRFERGAATTPELLVFDPAGNVIRGWGGSEHKNLNQYPVVGKDDWGTNTHTVYVDYKDNVWVAFGGTTGITSMNITESDRLEANKNAHVLKFNSEGKLLLEIGKFGQPGDSNSTMYLGQPSSVVVDPQTDEVYVADGYVNRRVAVFDANTGAYKRHWGAYGKKPVDVVPAGEEKQHFNIVECITITVDRFVYVCDRQNKRIQIFKTDGTFVREKITDGNPSDIILSRDPAQKFALLVSQAADRVFILDRASLDTLSYFGRRGHFAGEFAGAHSGALDSKGNFYVVETVDGRRIQKFVPVAATATTATR